MATRALDTTGADFLLGKTTPGMTSYVPPPNNAIRNVQLSSGNPLAVSNLPNGAGASGITSDSTPSTTSQFANIISLLKQAQSGGLQEQALRDASTPASLAGASPGQQTTARNASVEALSPVLGGLKTSIEDYNTALSTTQAHAENVMKTILDTTDPQSLKQLDSKYLNKLEQDAGYPKGFINSAVTYKQKQADVAASKLNGSGGSSSTKYIPGDNPAADSWVQNINSGIAKLSDITGNPDLKNLVSQGLSQSHSAASTVLDTTKASIKELNDMVANNKGFSAAVGFPGITNYLPGSQAQDFKSKLKQVINEQVLPNLNVLKGLGRVTQTEFNTLQSALTSLGTNLSESGFKTELKNITDRINKISNANPLDGETKIYNGATYKIVNGNWVKQ